MKNAYFRPGAGLFKSKANVRFGFVIIKLDGE